MSQLLWTEGDEPDEEASDGGGMDARPSGEELSSHEKRRRLTNVAARTAYPRSLKFIGRVDAEDVPGIHAAALFRLADRARETALHAPSRR
jgi:hypothetical protein